MNIAVQIMPHGLGLEIPQYQTKGAAGMDVRAAVSEPISLAPLQRAAIPTGIKMSIPQGYEVQIRPRSGLAFRNGISIPNSPGTIDSDYRGEVKVLLINLGSSDFVVTRGMRIAQLVVAQVMQAQLHIVNALDDTGRGAGGFGSTGGKEDDFLVMRIDGMWRSRSDASDKRNTGQHRINRKERDRKVHKKDLPH